MKYGDSVLSAAFSGCAQTMFPKPIDTVKINNQNILILSFIPLTSCFNFFTVYAIRQGKDKKVPKIKKDRIPSIPESLN
jgi:hypothetical protein